MSKYWPNSSKSKNKAGGQTISDPQEAANWATPPQHPLYNQYAQHQPPAPPAQIPPPHMLPPATPLGNVHNYQEPRPPPTPPPQDLPPQQINGHTVIPLPRQMQRGGPTEPLPPNSNVHSFLNPGIQGTPIWDQNHTQPSPGGQQLDGHEWQIEDHPPPPPQPQASSSYSPPAPGQHPIYDQFSSQGQGGQPGQGGGYGGGQ